MKRKSAKGSVVGVWKAVDYCMKRVSADNVIFIFYDFVRTEIGTWGAHKLAASMKPA